MIQDEMTRVRNNLTPVEPSGAKAKEPPAVVTVTLTEAEVVGGDPHWVFLTKSNSELYYFFPEKTLVTTEGNVRTWIKQVPKVEQLDRDSHGHLILKSLIFEEFNCDNRMFRFVQITDFTYSGEVNTTYNSGTGMAWKASIGGEILDLVCAAAKKARKKPQ
jgi:hypothetical protein